MKLLGFRQNATVTLTGMRRKSVGGTYFTGDQYLKFIMLGEKFTRWQFEIFFFFFSLKTGFGISCKVSPLETICMNRQNSFFGGKKKKNIIKLSSAELER